MIASAAGTLERNLCKYMQYRHVRGASQNGEKESFGFQCKAAISRRASLKETGGATLNQLQGLGWTSMEDCSLNFIFENGQRLRES